MPQPLSMVRPKASIDVSSGAINRRPEFALPIMRVIAFWADIESTTALILSWMLQTDVAVGTAMYEALIGGQAKRAVLTAAAKRALPEWGQILLQAVLTATSGSRAQRNDFAHNLWATTEDLPDALLLMHSSVLVQHNISFRQVHIVNGAQVIKLEALDYSKIQVFRRKDFDRAVRDASQAELSFVYLYNAFSRHNERGPLQGRKLLLAQPSVRRAIDRLCRDGRRPTPPELIPGTGEEAEGSSS